jgi:hypothetical protein
VLLWWWWYVVALVVKILGRGPACSGVVWCGSGGEVGVVVWWCAMDAYDSVQTLVERHACHRLRPLLVDSSLGQSVKGITCGSLLCLDELGMYMCDVSNDWWFCRTAWNCCQHEL